MTDTDIIRTRGSLDLFASGDFIPEDQAYVLTRVEVPTTSLISGSANVYDGNPIPFAAAGGIGIGSNGRIIKVVSDYFGTFDEFAYFDSALPGHPFYGWIVATSSDRNTPTGDMLSAWKRFTRHVVPPRGARFVVPKIGLSGGVGNVQYLDAFQMQVVPINFGTPPTPDFAKPRCLKVSVRPTRLNYSVNPSYVSDMSGLLYEGATPTLDASRSIGGGGSLKVTVPSTATLPIRLREDQYLAVVPGDPLAISFKALIENSLSGTYKVAVDYYTEGLIPIGTVYSEDSLHDRADWRTVSFLTEVPEGADRATVSLVYADSAPAADDTFWIDQVLIEKSSLIGEYFDGSYGDDYLWKADGLPGQTWSYFYEDRAKRHYILERTLRENVPLGISIDDPEYAAGTATVQRFGYGPFGYGPFGG